MRCTGRFRRPVPLGTLNRCTVGERAGGSALEGKHCAIDPQTGSPKTVDIETYTLTIPREQDAADEPEAVEVWPLVQTALDRIDADPSTRDAARDAMEHGDGCVVLANFLNSEAKRVHEMDYRFKVPLVVMAAELAREDDTATSIYDPDEGCVYFETEVSQFSFHVYKDWTVDWPQVADEVQEGYEWSGEDNQTWALDWLMDFLDVPTDDYMV